MIANLNGRTAILFTSDFPDRVEQKTGILFRHDKLNCAESVFRALLEESGNSCPLELLRTASAFGRGMGGAGCCCGALIGGEMAVGFLFGRREENGLCPDVCGHVAKQLHDRFVEHNRVTCCRVLHKGLPYGTPEQFKACAKRTVKAARITAEVILRQ